MSCTSYKMSKNKKSTRKYALKIKQIARMYKNDDVFKDYKTSDLYIGYKPMPHNRALDVDKSVNARKLIDNQGAAISGESGGVLQEKVDIVKRKCCIVYQVKNMFRGVFRT